MTIIGSSFGFPRSACREQTDACAICSGGSSTTGCEPFAHYASYIALCDVLSDSRVRCTAQAGVGKEHAWQVSIGGQRSALSTATTWYESPTISSSVVLQHFATEGGTEIRLRGSSFGPASASSADWAHYGTLAMSLTSDETFFATRATVMSDSEIVAVTGEGTGAGHNWRVSIGGQVSNTVFFNESRYAAPIIKSVSRGAGENVHEFDTPGGELVTLWAPLAH